MQIIMILVNTCNIFYFFMRLASLPLQIGLIMGRILKEEDLIAMPNGGETENGKCSIKYFTCVIYLKIFFFFVFVLLLPFD